MKARAAADGLAEDSPLPLDDALLMRFVIAKKEFHKSYSALKHYVVRSYSNHMNPIFTLARNI